jgi:hypothetical protein
MGMEWVDLARGRERWRATVVSVTDRGVCPQEELCFMKSQATNVVGTTENSFYFRLLFRRLEAFSLIILSLLAINFAISERMWEAAIRMQLFTVLSQNSKGS